MGFHGPKLASPGELRPNSNWRSVLGIPTMGSKVGCGAMGSSKIFEDLEMLEENLDSIDISNFFGRIYGDLCADGPIFHI